MDEELTASERRAAKRRARAEAGKNAPTWAKVAAWSILGVAAAAVMFAILGGGPPKYGVIDKVSAFGTTTYAVGVTTWDDGHAEAITQDVWERYGGEVIVRIKCTANPLNERVLAVGRQSAAGATRVTVSPDARCP